VEHQDGRAHTTPQTDHKCGHPRSLHRNRRCGMWRRRIWVSRSRLKRFERLKHRALDQLGWVELELRERRRVFLAAAVQSSLRGHYQARRAAVLTARITSMRRSELCRPAPGGNAPVLITKWRVRAQGRYNPSITLHTPASIDVTTRTLRVRGSGSPLHW
jgi:hypothetical protein